MNKRDSFFDPVRSSLAWMVQRQAAAANIPPVCDWSTSISGLQVTFTDLSTDSDGTINSWAWDFGDSSTSTSQNPVHTYTLVGTYSVTLTVTDNRGGTHFKTANVTVDIASKDGPSSAIRVPLSAGDFTALSLPTPDFLWPCQEASGALVPTIGNAAITLAANASPLYQQTVTNWTRKGTGTADGTAGQRHGSTSSSLNLAAGQSCAWLVYASVNASTATRRFLGRPTTNGIRIDSTDHLITVHGSVAASAGASAYSDLNTVHPFLWYRNATTNVSGLMTDAEHILGTHDESAISAVLWCLGADSTNNPPDGRYLWAAYWIGASAETIAAKATLTGLGWTVAW